MPIVSTSRINDEQSILTTPLKLHKQHHTTILPTLATQERLCPRTLGMTVKLYQPYYNDVSLFWHHKNLKTWNCTKKFVKTSNYWKVMNRCTWKWWWQRPQHETSLHCCHFVCSDTQIVWRIILLPQILYWDVYTKSTKLRQYVSCFWMCKLTQ